MSEAQEPLETIGRPRPARVGALRRGGVITARWVPYVIAFAVALTVYLGAFDHIRAQHPTGDEPSYILDAISMARDGDRDLSNQFDARHPASLIKLFEIPAIPHG